MLYVLSTSETKIAGYKFPFLLLFLFIYLIFLGRGACLWINTLSFLQIFNPLLHSSRAQYYVTDVSPYNQITKLYNTAVNIHAAISREPPSSR